MTKKLVTTNLSTLRFHGSIYGLNTAKKLMNWGKLNITYNIRISAFICCTVETKLFLFMPIPYAEGNSYLCDPQILVANYLLYLLDSNNAKCQ